MLLKSTLSILLLAICIAPAPAQTFTFRIIDPTTIERFEPDPIEFVFEEPCLEDLFEEFLAVTSRLDVLNDIFLLLTTDVGFPDEEDQDLLDTLIAQFCEPTELTEHEAAVGFEDPSLFEVVSVSYTHLTLPTIYSV